MIYYTSSYGPGHMASYVAGVVKRLTRRFVAPLRVGSSPTTRPIFFYLELHMGVSPSGKATDFDSVIGGPTPPTPARDKEL